MESTTSGYQKDTVAHGEVTATRRGSPQSKPAWITVLLVIALLCVAALPGTVTAGVTPILLVVTAVVLLLSVFTKD
jgi:hypothetical protein